jgi:FK506-binding protein 4/5
MLNDEAKTVFDSSLDKRSPLRFTVGKGVIKGWSEAVTTMRVGEKARFTIAPAKAYGKQGRPPTIPANSTLVFEIQLLGYSKPGLYGPSSHDVCSDGTVLKRLLSPLDGLATTGKGEGREGE